MDSKTIARVRNESPGCADKIFLNSAGSSLMPSPVLKAIQDYLEEEKQYGGYWVADQNPDQIEDFYTSAAALLNCSARNIAYTHDATEAYSRALSSIPFEPHDFIITTDDDYTSNHIQFLSLQKRFQINVVRINNLDNGDLDLHHFETLIRQHKPRLVAVTHVPNNSGLIQDVIGIGKLCRAHDLLYLVDACQSVGQLPVDVTEIQCDFLSATGRKFLRGPRGTGFLYVSDRVLKSDLHPLFIDGRSATWKEEAIYAVDPTARRYETWEVPYALMMGLREAFRYVTDLGIEQIAAHNSSLMEPFRAALRNIDGVEVFDKGSRQCNILTWRKTGTSLEKTQRVLDAQNIYHSVSTRSWGLIDFDKKGIEWAIRFSPHYFNNADELGRVAEIIKEL